ncbi:MAG: hypothetical protein COT74_09420 [Bdellovibrionales bacterium CG10_big_fil_rev_8_21_14_0_10_45_34]|nr:MAG: hypothetical protein COT74_09420 [Bdellovibrionales bacterium CG10_big_fil_rev_8_21_14_0_10_45_34]
MSRNKVKNVTYLITSLLALAGCAKNESTTPAASAYSYSGPGSHYTVSATGATYTINKYASSSDTSADMTVTATGTDVNGFKKLSVTSSSGTGAPAAGSAAYGLEVPGMALFIKPIDSGNPDQVVAAVSAGACPSSALNANWVIVKQADSSDVSSGTQDTFGTFTYSAASGVASVATRYSLAAVTTDLGANTFTASTCSGGIMTVGVPGDTSTMYLTSNGGAIVNTATADPTQSTYIFGLPVTSITGTTYSGTYSGFVYMGGQSTGNKFKVVKFTLTGASSSITGTGNIVTDVDTDTTSSDTVSLNISALNSPSTGLMAGTLTSPSGSGTVACMAVSNANGTGKQVINCAGADPGDTTKLFNFLLVSR